MGQTEIITFIVLLNVILLIFIFGIIIFVFQYRRRKVLYEKEKALIEQQHRAEILNTQLKIQLQTMQFIGREIHDSVAQKLTLASIYSQKLEFENQVPEISPKLSRISGILNDSLTELRDLSKTLTDNRIQDTDLVVLLRTECERVNDTGICKAVLAADFDQKISVTVKSFLLRIVQEFIQNSLKHARCDRINIYLESNAGGLSLRASDDGNGFDSSNTDFKGIGLNNMKRRIHLIGGIFNLQSEPGKGTSLELTISNEKLLAE
jgi:signal transduction histidine kinase